PIVLRRRRARLPGRTLRRGQRLQAGRQIAVGEGAGALLDGTARPLEPAVLAAREREAALRRVGRRGRIPGQVEVGPVAGDLAVRPGGPVAGEVLRDAWIDAHLGRG